MRTKIKMALTIGFCISFFLALHIKAEDKQSSVPYDNSSTVETASDPKGMKQVNPTDSKSSAASMGSMDMQHMKEMMSECMKVSKNGKTCKQETMGKCEETMSKMECHKMMKKIKSGNKK